MWRIRRKQSEPRGPALESVDVLVIDDADASADLTLLGIRRAAPSAKVVRFRDANKALSFVFLAELSPSLILLDSGNTHSVRQILERLRSSPRTSSVPVILLAATRDPPAWTASQSLGTSDFVVKAVTREEFCDQVKAIIERWLPKHAKRSSR
jgi:response regulator RpfG family c-di-GMP phosphodiesterase